MEEVLATSSLPTSTTALPLASYVDILCSLLDIPVYKYATFQSPSTIQSIYQAISLWFNRGTGSKPEIQYI